MASTPDFYDVETFTVVKGFNVWDTAVIVIKSII